MSSWIHVNSLIRIWTIPEQFDDVILKIKEKIIEIGLPKGSEGPLSYSVCNQKEEVQLIIFGNLRDCYIKYARKIVETIISYTSDLNVRQGFIQIDCGDKSVYFVESINNSWKEIIEEKNEGN